MEKINTAIGGLQFGNTDYHYRFWCSVCHSALIKIVLYVKDDKELYLKCRHGHECVVKGVDEKYHKRIKYCYEKNVYKPK